MALVGRIVDDSPNSPNFSPGKLSCYTVFCHWLCFIHSHQVPLASVIAMTLISTSQASEQLNYTPTWPADDCCKAIHVRLAMMQSVLCAYNASSQLVSIKGTFVESPNARKVAWVSMVNPFWLNGMETQGFQSAKPPTPLCSTEPVV